MTSRPAAIGDRHLRRGAVAYLRQSTPQQLRDHGGSTLMQKEDLPALLQEWGWSPKRIEVIDEDLGVSGATPGARRGFNHLIDRMKAGIVGIVAVTEVSRLGRNIPDFAMFATVAREYDVLYVHSGQVVDFRDPNSEFVGLLLGLNAVRENRSRIALGRRARLKKAESGLAVTRPPRGYVTTSPGLWGKDPDPQVRDAIQLVFDKFLELGSAAGVARWFRRCGVRLPGKRSRRGPQRWSDATHYSILEMLRNPVYSGVYIFGRHSTDELTKRQLKRAPTEWIRVEAHHEPYIGVELWTEIQRRLTANRPHVRPPIGRGDTLLQGLLKCAVHKVTLQTFYPARKFREDGTARRSGCYRCQAPIAAEPWRCGQILASHVDRAVEAEALRTLVPPTVVELREAARAAFRAHEAVIRAREDELRRADQAVAEAERALSQVIDRHPYRRAKLAEREEEALRRRAEIRQFHLLNPLTPPVALDHGDLTELQQLVQDLPALWTHPSVAAEQRKAILRTIIDSVYVDPRPGVWTLEIRWVGGARTILDVLTPRGLQAVVLQDYQHGLSPAAIAEGLTRRGILRPLGPLTAAPYTELSIRRMLARALPIPRPLEAPAYPYIASGFNEGLTSQAIADELNARGLPHLLGAWTARRVEGALRTMRRKAIPGIQPLRVSPPLKDSVRQLYEAGRSPREIAAQLNEQKVLTRRRRPVSKKTVLLILWRLGFKSRLSAALPSPALRTSSSGYR